MSGKGYVVTTQPGHEKGQAPDVQWMAPPPEMTGVPPGLEYLTQIDQLVCCQQVELVEAITGFQTKNRFRILNSMGQQVYFAKEESTCAQRQFCGPSRGFEFNITDNNGQNVLKLIRKFKCCGGCCWCADRDSCAYELEVLSPVTGDTLGYVRQAKYCCDPRIHILSAERTVVGIIKGQCCMCHCPKCKDIEFPLYTPDGSMAFGKISKQWTGAVKEIFTQADNFSVTFPMDLDVNTKATIFGATFLVDMMFFEEDKNNK